MFRLAFASLLLSGSALAQEPSAAQPGVAIIDVDHGRAVLHVEDRTERTLRSDDRTVVQGPTHLEVAPGSEVTVSWMGRASLRIWGPAALQWRRRPGTGEAGRGMPSFSDEGIEWHVFDLAWADLEVRRGKHRMQLPGDWRMDCADGAWHLRGLPAGPIELRHHAGSPARLTWIGDPDRPRPPLTIYSGSNLRIDRPAPSPEDSTARAPEWDRHEWPWREPVEEARESTERPPAVSESRPSSKFPAFPGREPLSVRSSRVRDADPEGVRAHAEQVRRGSALDLGSRSKKPSAAQPERVLPPPTDGVAPSYERPAPQRKSAETEPRRPGKVGPEARPVVLPTTRAEPKSFRSEHWRGLSLADLAPAGRIGVQRGAGVEVRIFASGRYKVFVDALAKGPTWCFAPDRDYQLQPGAVAVFEEDGSLRLQFGRIEEHEPLRGRPAFDHLKR